jgi:hypothetical protein
MTLTLKKLPLEIYICVFDFCSILDILKYGQTCKYNRYIVQSIITFLVNTKKKNAVLWKDFNPVENLSINYTNFINMFYSEIKYYILKEFPPHSSLYKIASEFDNKKFIKFYNYYTIFGGKEINPHKSSINDYEYSNNLLYYLYNGMKNMNDKHMDNMAKALKFNKTKCTNFVSYIITSANEMENKTFNKLLECLPYNKSHSSNYVYYLQKIVSIFDKKSYQQFLTYLRIKYPGDNENKLYYILEIFKKVPKQKFKKYMKIVNKNYSIDMYYLTDAFEKLNNIELEVFLRGERIN